MFLFLLAQAGVVPATVTSATAMSKKIFFAHANSGSRRILFNEGQAPKDQRK